MRMQNDLQNLCSPAAIIALLQLENTKQNLDKPLPLISE